MWLERLVEPFHVRLLSAAVFHPLVYIDKFRRGLNAQAKLIEHQSLLVAASISTHSSHPETTQQSESEKGTRAATTIARVTLSSGRKGSTITQRSSDHPGAVCV